MAAYAASSIANANTMKIGFNSVRLVLVGFISSASFSNIIGLILLGLALLIE